VAVGAVAQAEANVSGHAQMRKEREVLKQHPDAPPLGGERLARRRHPPAMQPDLTGGDRLEAGDGPQQRGLAAAARAEQTGDLAGGEREVDRVRAARCSP
jgi:hypothetical protein